MKVLLVEDSRPTRAIMRRYLEELKLEVVEAGDGNEALERAREGPSFDVILVDWNMPGMDGCELIRQLREMPAFQRVPIMMVTTENQLEQVAIALERGANEFLMKPFDRRALEEKLALIGIEPGRHAA